MVGVACNRDLLGGYPWQTVWLQFEIRCLIKECLYSYACQTFKLDSFAHSNRVRIKQTKATRLCSRQCDSLYVINKINDFSTLSLAHCDGGHTCQVSHWCVFANKYYWGKHPVLRIYSSRDMHAMPHATRILERWMLLTAWSIPWNVWTCIHHLSIELYKQGKD